MGTTNINLDVSSLLGPLETSAGAISALATIITEMNDNIKYVYETVKETRDCIVHLHDAHFHAKSHTCQDRFEVGCGYAMISTAMSFSSRLMLEYQNNVDNDGNGLIYGKDFLVNPNDPNCPPSLRENAIPVSSTIRYISWNAYLQTIPDGAKG